MNFNKQNIFLWWLFIQLQHSLEAQIAALVSNLQVLQQNQTRQQKLQDKEKKTELQRQMEDRLQRLEELQAKMLQAQVNDILFLLNGFVSRSRKQKSQPFGQFYRPC